MKKIKWILPLGLTATAAAIAPAITSCSCFKRYNVSIEGDGSLSDLCNQHFKIKYHKTIDKTGTWQVPRAVSWEVYIGKDLYKKGDSDQINIYNNGDRLYIHIGWQKVEKPIKIRLW